MSANGRRPLQTAGRCPARLLFPRRGAGGRANGVPRASHRPQGVGVAPRVQRPPRVWGVGQRPALIQAASSTWTDPPKWGRFEHRLSEWRLRCTHAKAGAAEQLQSGTYRRWVSGLDSGRACVTSEPEVQFLGFKWRVSLHLRHPAAFSPPPPQEDWP